LGHIWDSGCLSESTHPVKGANSWVPSCLGEWWEVVAAWFSPSSTSRSGLARRTRAEPPRLGAEGHRAARVAARARTSTPSGFTAEATSCRSRPTRRGSVSPAARRARHGWSLKDATSLASGTCGSQVANTAKPPRFADYALIVKTIWTGRVAEVTAKYGENAPLAAVCCNACRMCVTTNVIGIVMGAVGGVALAVANFGRRRFFSPG
jgi:hypothetical protein